MPRILLHTTRHTAPPIKKPFKKDIRHQKYQGLAAQKWAIEARQHTPQIIRLVRKLHTLQNRFHMMPCSDVVESLYKVDALQTLIKKEALRIARFHAGTARPKKARPVDAEKSPTCNITASIRPIIEQIASSFRQLSRAQLTMIIFSILLVGASGNSRNGDTSSDTTDLSFPSNGDMSSTSHIDIQNNVLTVTFPAEVCPISYAVALPPVSPKSTTQPPKGVSGRLKVLSPDASKKRYDAIQQSRIQINDGIERISQPHQDIMEESSIIRAHMDQAQNKFARHLGPKLRSANDDNHDQLIAKQRQYVATHIIEHGLFGSHEGPTIFNTLQVLQSVPDDEKNQYIEAAIRALRTFAREEHPPQEINRLSGLIHNVLIPEESDTDTSSRFNIQYQLAADWVTPCLYMSAKIAIGASMPLLDDNYWLLKRHIDIYKTNPTSPGLLTDMDLEYMFNLDKIKRTDAAPTELKIRFLYVAHWFYFHFKDKLPSTLLDQLSTSVGHVYDHLFSEDPHYSRPESPFNMSLLQDLFFGRTQETLQTTTIDNPVHTEPDEFIQSELVDQTDTLPEESSYTKNSAILVCLSLLSLVGLGLTRAVMKNRQSTRLIEELQAQIKELQRTISVQEIILQAPLQSRHNVLLLILKQLSQNVNVSHDQTLVQQSHDLLKATITYLDTLQDQLPIMGLTCAISHSPIEGMATFLIPRRALSNIDPSERNNYIARQLQLPLHLREPNIAPHLAHDKAYDFNHLNTWAQRPTAAPPRHPFTNEPIAEYVTYWCPIRTDLALKMRLAFELSDILRQLAPTTLNTE